MPDNKSGKKLPKRVGNSRKKDTRSAAWNRAQARKKRNRERNEALHKAKEARRANGTLTETDKMWEEVKDKFAERRHAWSVERNSSDWSRAVGRVKGRRVTLPSKVKFETKPEDNGKPKDKKDNGKPKAKKERVQRSKKERTRA